MFHSSIDSSTSLIYLLRLFLLNLLEDVYWRQLFSTSGLASLHATLAIGFDLELHPKLRSTASILSAQYQTFHRLTPLGNLSPIQIQLFTEPLLLSCRHQSYSYSRNTIIATRCLVSNVQRGFTTVDFGFETMYG